MPKKYDEIYYAAKGFIRNKLTKDIIFKGSWKNKRYAGMTCTDEQGMNEYIAGQLRTGKPFMACRFGGFELFAMRVAEFNQQKKLDLAIKFLDQSAGFFPADKKLLPRFNEVMKDACKQVDAIGAWLLPYEDYYIRKYCGSMKQIGSIMSLEPWKVMDNPWTKELKGKKVLVIHPFEETIKSQYEKHDRLFENPQLLPDFELITLKAVQTSGSQTDERFKNWFEALDYMCRECEKIDFDVALIGCGAYGFPIAAHIKKMGKQAIHIGGVLQILFGIKGRRWDESDTRLMYNEHWVYPGKNEIPQGAEKVEGACYWAVEEKESDEKRDSE